ncbi:MAG: hypothetical protein H6735_07980 [Alphaproteobacteria bacterium]|nr:hypothetical protein [Alphaproteobacteria bacterium]
MDRVSLSLTRRERPYTWKGQQIRRRGKWFDYADYDDLFNQQNGRCALCGVSFPDSGEDKYGMSIDHDNDRPNAHTNVRALLCKECNSHRLGKYKDDPAFIQRAVDYLRHYQAVEKRSGVSALDNPPPLPIHD